MKKLPQGFDSFSFMNPVEPMYCQNDSCEKFGDVTVVGLAHSFQPDNKENKNK